MAINLEGVEGGLLDLQRKMEVFTKWRNALSFSDRMNFDALVRLCAADESGEKVAKIVEAGGDSEYTRMLAFAVVCSRSNKRLPKDVQTRKIMLRLTDEEYEDIRSGARSRGQSMNSFIREVIRAWIEPPVSDEDPAPPNVA